MKQVVAIDCEMVGCYPSSGWPSTKKGKPNSEISVAAQCALVDYNNKVLYKSYIKPPSELKVTRLGWRGLNPAEVEKGVPFEKARRKILSIMNDKIIVAHDIGHDLASLKIKIGDDIPSSKVRDTATCQLLRRRAGIPSHYPKASLRSLASGVLKKTIQNTFPHDPEEDARVAMELYRCVEEEWEEREEETS